MLEQNKRKVWLRMTIKLWYSHSLAMKVSFNYSTRRNWKNVRKAMMIMRESTPHRIPLYGRGMLQIMTWSLQNALTLWLLPWVYVFYFIGYMNHRCYIIVESVVKCYLGVGINMVPFFFRRPPFVWVKSPQKAPQLLSFQTLRVKHMK